MCVHHWQPLVVHAHTDISGYWSKGRTHTHTQTQTRMKRHKGYEREKKTKISLSLNGMVPSLKPTALKSHFVVQKRRWHSDEFPPKRTSTVYTHVHHTHSFRVVNYYYFVIFDDFFTFHSLWSAHTVWKASGCVWPLVREGESIISFDFAVSVTLH